MVVEAFANIKHCVQTDMDYHKKSNHPPPPTPARVGCTSPFLGGKSKTCSW